MTINTTQSLLKIPETISPEEYSVLLKQHFQREHKDFVSFVINELDVDYKSRILEIGSRAGWLSIELARRLPEAKVIGLDNNEQLVQIANLNKQQEKITNVEFVTGSLDDLSQFLNQSFDVVISFNVLHLLNDPQKILNEVKRILKKNGKYVISDYRSDLKLLAKAAIWFNARTMPEDFRQSWKKIITTSYKIEDVVKLLLKTKLKDWKIRTSLFDFFIYKA